MRPNTLKKNQVGTDKGLGCGKKISGNAILMTTKWKRSKINKKDSNTNPYWCRDYKLHDGNQTASLQQYSCLELQNNAQRVNIVKQISTMAQIPTANSMQHTEDSDIKLFYEVFRTKYDSITY